jgi:tetratricopeptide (TPR) repeat protein
VVQRTQATIERAVREFKKAIALDPDYALAHAELAIATLLLDVYGDLTLSEAIARAVPHAERAMALDPTLAEAHAATGFLLYQKGNLEKALTHFGQAIQINSNYSIVHNWMGMVLGEELGRYGDAFAVHETSLRLDPLSLPPIINYVFGLIARNRLDEADRELEKLASISPSWSAGMQGNLTSHGGKWANLVLGRLDALRIDPSDLADTHFLTWWFAAIGLGKEALTISETTRPVVLRMLGRPEDAVTTAQARLAEDPISLPAHQALGLALAAAGNYARAQPILEEMWQHSGGLVTTGGLFRDDEAAALITIRRTTGEETRVGELVAAIKDNVRRSHEAGITVSGITGGDGFTSADYEEGIAAYLSGEHKRGLALIAKAAEDGFFILPNEAYLQELYEDPRFAPIRATQEARQARERERFLAIVCTDNPYEAVWQPAEGTCERFAATGGK